MHRHFLDQFTKLRLWSLGGDEEGPGLGLESLVYLDADTLAFTNFDELLTLPFPFAAVPDVYLDSRGYTLSINAGVLVVRPTGGKFGEMVEGVGRTRFEPEQAEQAFLNAWFGGTVVRLPFVYNANLAIKVRSPGLWDVLRPASAAPRASPLDHRFHAGAGADVYVDLDARRNATDGGGDGERNAQARIVHYTLVKPFLRGDYEEVAFEEVERNALGKVGERGGLFREEVMDWVEAWRETRERFAERFERCGHDVFGLGRA